MNKKFKISILIGLIFVLGICLSPLRAKALTVEEMQALIIQLQIQIAQLQQQLLELKGSETCHITSLWSWNYCSYNCKCNAGEGDCDSNTDCYTGYCAQNVGAKYGQVSSMDVCEEAEETTCTDSDGGKDYYTKGIVTVTEQGSTGRYYDICKTDFLLTEWYCGPNSGARSTEHQCPYGCDNGACIRETEANDPVSGTLSVDKTSVNTGEDITLTITAQDDQGVSKVAAYYQSDWGVYHQRGWHYLSCSGETTCTKTFTFSESEPGIYYYYGYVYGKKTDGTSEESKTDPYYVKVKVNSSSSTCTDSDGGIDYYVKGVTYGKNYAGLAIKNWDVCSTDIQGREMLREHYCQTQTVPWSDKKEAIVVEEGYICPYGCEDGVCNPGITVISPNGGEQLSGNETYKITWKQTGDLYEKVDILLGGYDQPGSQIDDWKLIVAGVSTSQGYYYWAPYGVPLYVPSCFSATPYKYKIKIREATDRADAIIDESGNYFSIISTEQEDLVSGTLSVDKTSINTGEDITLTITAQDDQGVNKVRAYYQGSWHYQYCGGDTSCTKIWTFKELTPSTKYYYGYIYGYKTNQATESTKTVPYYVKVTVTEPISACTDSDGGKDYYTKGTVALGSTEYKDYCTGNSLLVEYSCPTTEDQTIDWGEILVITDIYTCPYGCEDGACKPGITVISPNGGEEWVQGSIHDITWSSTGSINQVGVTICMTISSYEAVNPSEERCSVTMIVSNTGSYSWTIGRAAAIGDYTVKIEDTDGPSIYDESDNYFSIVSVAATCTDSDGGKDYYLKGESKSSSSAIEGRWDCCKLEYSTYMGDSVKHIGPGGGSCVDEGPYLYEAICGTDGNPTTIVYNCPNGCKNGACIVGKCTDSDGGEDFYTRGEVTENIESSGWKDNTFPDMCVTDSPLGNLAEAVCKYRQDGNYYYGSQVYYNCPYGCRDGACLKSQPKITVVSPNGGEEWEVGNTYEISWISEGLPSDNKISEIVLKSSNSRVQVIVIWTTNDGKYQWTVPSGLASGDNYKIYIEYAYNGVLASDESDNYFSITKPATCADSDQGDLYTKGYCEDSRHVNDGWDVCSDAVYQGGLIEYTCTDSYSGKVCGTQHHSCPYGCKDGACLREPQEKNDPVSGSLSVSSAQVNTGDAITLTVTAQDDQGVSRVTVSYGGSWHTQYCQDQTSCTRTFSFSESSAGTKYYYGYVYGKTISGSTESAKTVPYSVIVIVTFPASTCSDSDNGDLYIKGYCQDSRHVNDGWDICSNAVYQGGLIEYTCTDSYLGNVCGTKHHQCPYGCKDGACIKEQVGGACTDSDGGANYYVKGTATPSSSAIDGRVDCCKLSYSTYMGDSVNHIGPGGGACVTSGTYLYEAICGNDGNPTTVVYECPNGCQNGVCVSASSKAERREDLSSMLASIQAAIENLLKQLQELKLKK